MSSLRDQALIEKLNRIKERAEIYKVPVPIHQLRLVDQYRDVLERNGLLEEFKPLLDDVDRHRKQGSLKSGFDNNFIIPSSPSMRNSSNNEVMTYVKEHFRRNKNGSISCVRGHSRRT